MKLLKLNIQLFASGSDSTTIYSPASSTYGYKLGVSWNEGTVNTANNTSPISITGTFSGANIRFSGSGDNTLAIYWIDNNTNTSPKLIASKTITSTSKGTTYSVNGSITATHKSDGTLKGHARVVWTKTSGSYVPPTTTLNSTDTSLTTIPRKTAIGNISGVIGNTITISWSRASTSFTHTVKYTYGDLSGTIGTGKTDSCSWTIPTTFYSKTPKKTGTGTITLETYSGSTLIGSSSATLTVSCDENACKPTVTISAVDTNSVTTNLTANANKIVKGVSNAKVTVATTVKNSATIKSVIVNGVSLGVSASSTYTFNATDTSTFSVTVTDSRDFSSTSTVTKELVNYIPVTVNGVVERNTPTDGKINMSLSGNFFNASFGSVANTLTVQYRYKASDTTTWSTWGSITPTKSGNTFTLSKTTLSGTFNYQKNYDFQMRVIDKVNTSGYVINLSVTKGEPVYWWNEETFNVMVDTYIKGSLIATINNIYPVGSLYISINNTNPETLFPGTTWQQQKDYYLYFAGDVHAGGTTGGSRTHTLTVDEIPSHRHSGTTDGAGSHSHTLGQTSSNLQSGSSYGRIRSSGYGDSEAYTTNTVANHTHTFNTGYTGGGKSFNIEPTYKAFYAWVRTA